MYCLRVSIKSNVNRYIQYTVQSVSSFYFLPKVNVRLLCPVIGLSLFPLLMADVIGFIVTQVAFNIRY